MRLLNKEDFKGFNFKTNQSGIDMLADICSVATKVLQQEKRRRLKGKEIIQQKENQIAHGLKLGIPETTTTGTVTTASPQHPPPPRRKRSRNDQKMIKSSNKSTKRKRAPSNFVRQPAPSDPASYRDLPGEFRREIEAMEGTNIKLVIQKQLYESDLKSNNNRLSIPFSQIVDVDFLREAEKDTLRRQKAIEDVPLLIRQPDEQRMEVMNINLRQWDMAKESGKTSSCYVLRTSWKDVVERNGLEEDDVVQVWSFRVTGDRLHLALVVVTRANHQLGSMPARTSSTSSGAASSGSSGSNGSRSSSGSSGNSNITTEATPPCSLVKERN